MLWILSGHIIFMVAWFAGLFYLPRLFVYHRLSSDRISIERFKLMERKLYYYIMTPSGMLTTGLGLWLLSFHWNFYIHQAWMQAKLILVGVLWIYHGACWYWLKCFREDRVNLSSKFFRWFNEISILLLIGIVVLVIVKP